MTESEGTYALRELQTGRITPQDLYCQPDKAEVPDGMQLVVMEDGAWLPYRRQTREEKLMDIRAYLDAAIERLDEL